MAVTTSKFKWVAAAAIALVLAVASTKELPTEDTQAGAMPQKLSEMIESIKNGEAEEEAEAAALEDGLVAMASPCIMRRPRMALGVERSWRHAFAAATLIPEPKQRIEVLNTLMTTAPDELSRWRIDIAFVETALRVQDSQEAARHLGNAASRSVAETCRADEAFFAAALADSSKETADFLSKSVAFDPSFWAALEQLALVSAAGTGNDAVSCELDAVRTLETVVRLGALAQKDTQFQRLNRALEAMPSNGRTALLRGIILRQTNEIEAARAAYQAGLASLGQSTCDAILRQGLMEMLAATESEI